MSVPDLLPTDRRGASLVKHCAWLGAELGCIVLSGIAIFVALGFMGLLLYKSFKLDVSMSEVLAAAGENAKTPNFMWNLGLRLVGAIVIGTIICGITGAAVGTLTAIVKHRRRLH